nr:ATP synthase F1 gamma subunit [Ipomoea batatas]
MRSTVGLLEPGTSTATTELLGLAAPRVSYKQESYERLGDGLTDGVDLGSVTSSFDANANVHTGEAVAAQEEDRLEGLVAEDLRLDQLDWDAVDLDESAAALAVSHCHRRLLTPEALNRFYRRRRHVSSSPSPRLCMLRLHSKSEKLL